MNFLQYKSTVEKIISRKHTDIKLDLDGLFESYINDVDPKNYVMSLRSMNESSNIEKMFNRYLKSVANIVKKSGYTIKKMPRELNEDVIDMYNDGYNSTECADYIIEQLDKNTVKVGKQLQIDDVLLRNKLLFIVHNIDGVALKDVETKKGEAFAILRIKLFDMANEINTDVKSYLMQLDKYFRPYIKQNIDNANRLEILGYTLNRTSVFCTVKLRIDFLEPDETGISKFSSKETASNIQLYANIFKTFNEQYRNLL